MFYVVGFSAENSLIGVQDTEDGVVEYLTAEQIQEFRKKAGIKVEGFNYKTNHAKPVQLTKITNDIRSKFTYLIRQTIKNYTLEQCYIKAGDLGCKRAVKAADPNRAEINKILYDKMVTPSVVDAIKGAEPYSNDIVEVNCSDRAQIINALMNNVCLCIQMTTKSALTAFCCTANIALLDSLYAPKFIDKVFLTKNAYSLLARPQYIRESEREYQFKPENLEVFSCALRFRPKEAKKYEGTGQMELSSPMYTVNTERLLGMYVLRQPRGMGDTIMQEFQKVAQALKGQIASLDQLSEHYDFSFGLYNLIENGLVYGVNPLGTKDAFAKNMIVVDTTKADLGVKKFQENWDYMAKMRQEGYSISLKKRSI